MDFRQMKAIEKANKERILKVCPAADEESGIYIFTREERGYRYAYIGQAVRLLTRLANHLKGYQHIDLSIKKHGFYGAESPTGWRLEIIHFNKDLLNEKEQEYIKAYANAGFQMRNKTAGSQSNGKFEIAETKPKKGYRDGLEQGYKNAQRDVKKLFDKYLRFDCFSLTCTKREINAMTKFKEFLEGEK